MHFSKWQGCGNDFVLVDCFKENVDDFAAFAKQVCDRHYGIGGDGVLYVLPSDKADFRMRIFNTDGSEAEMCGNGIRCFARYLHDFGLTAKEAFTVETGAGILVPRLQLEAGKVTGVRVDMGEPVLEGEKIPVKGFGMDRVIEEDITVKGQNYKMTCVSMGNPHCVIFCEDDIDALDLPRIGPDFEHHPAFPERVNTEFINVLGTHELKMRVWERGSGETWACGTGTCAAAVAAVLNGFCPKNEDILVHLRGGDLTIRYTDETVWMTGPAVAVFEGTVEA